MRLLTRMKNLEIELPVVNKFLLCLPLRPGLMAWGYLQLIANIVISVYASVDFAEKSPHYHGLRLVEMIVIFMIIMIVSLLEVIFCGFLILGAQKKNANFLEVCYHYQKAKVVVYAGLWIVFFLVSTFMSSQSWFNTNLDPWRHHILNDNMALGALDWILQFYLLICVRSELLRLEHVVDLSSLYQRLNAHNDVSIWQNTLHEEPQKQPLPQVCVA